MVTTKPSDMSLAHVLPLPLDDKNAQEFLKKFQWAVKRVTNEHRNGSDPTLSQDELIQLIKTWEPKRDIICLYVRWSRQLRRNFNLDSIAALLCLSRQCGYTPIDFLRKVKTLSVHKNQQSRYKVSFHFDIPNRKDINRERLNKEFLGLSVTLSLLQEQTVDSPSILGKIKMRDSKPRVPYAMAIPVEVDGESKKTPATIVTHPTTEFHTQTSLLNRIWTSINHRWLALFITEHLFRDLMVSWSYQDALVYSFQMMAPCGPGRFEFLSPLVGYCLRFRSPDAIAGKRSQLRRIWQDPSLFLSYGNTCLAQFSTEAKSRIISLCMQELRQEVPTNSRKISYHRSSSWNRRWLILCAYVFHFWLDSASNSSLKSTILDEIAQVTITKKRKKEMVVDNPIVPDSSKKLHMSTVGSSNLPSTETIPCSNGLRNIFSSRLKMSSSSRYPKSSDNEVQKNTDQEPRETTKIPVVTPTQTCRQSHTAYPLTVLNWSMVRLIGTDELKRHVQSFLLIHCDDGIDIQSELSPLEVYSANKLHDFEHGRLSGKPPLDIPPEKCSSATLHLRNDSTHFVDRYNDVIHIARADSEYFLEHGPILPCMTLIQQLCQTIVTHGRVVDTVRGNGQYRLNFGNGGQNWVEGAPCSLHGHKFLLNMEEQSHGVNVRSTIGKIVYFTWRIMTSLQQDANNHPIAPDELRKQMYARQLNKLLNIEDQDVGFEDVTLVVSSLYPVAHEVAFHKDVMNDTLAGYTRTAAFNMVMIEDGGGCPNIIHLQVICNFRKVIGHYIVPFYQYLSPVAKHARTYIEKWLNSIHAVFAGKTTKVPTLYDRTSFYLDDSLTYQDITICEKGRHKVTLTSEYLLTEVNISRTLSLSMFIDPIVKLKRFIKFDQSIELAFACSFLANPFWFDWCLSRMIKRLHDPEDTYEIGLHPFYDWVHTSIEIFGGWQGGPYNRWSPCGGAKESILQTFGAQPGATPIERGVGEEKLTKVISVLWEHINWINSLSLSGDELPVALLKTQCDRTIESVSVVASCQFSHFRLGIFTTILSGCGYLREGRHLRNLMYPVKGSASYKHLSRPIPDVMSLQRARELGANTSTAVISNDYQDTIHEDNHDRFMQFLSYELGFPFYNRDEIECILCESHPMRTLNCRDWFRRGMAIYDCNDKGEYFRREYGRNTKWEKLSAPLQYDFAYLADSKIQYISLDPQLSYYASYFGNELRADNQRKITFKGRASRTSGNQISFTNGCTKMERFGHPSMQVADFYHGAHVESKKLKSMFVLGDGEHAVQTIQCNDLRRFQYGEIMHQHLRSLLVVNDTTTKTAIAAGCYHMDSEFEHSEVTFFPGHVDKPFVHTVWFVPLGSTAFFTLISVAQSICNVVQDEESLRKFNEWKDTLSATELTKVDDFLTAFEVQAKRYKTVESTVTLIYLNKCGSVLSFPANCFYHATITPKKPIGFPRDVFIFHPLDGLT